MRRNDIGVRHAQALSLVLGMAVASVVVTSAGAGTSWLSTQSTSRIAFASFAPPPSGGFRPTIYTVNPDGSDLRSVGQGGWPAWSPSGREFTFQDPSRALWDIGVMAADGAHPQRLARAGYAPHWSPDGRLIAFSSSEPRRWGIYVVSARGGRKRLLTRSGSFPVWSPDGARILFSGGADSPTKPRGLYTMKPDGSDQRLVRRGSYSFPEWSPDGSRIAAVGDRHVYVLNADGSGLRQLPRTVYTKNNDCSLAWSPDGASIAFTPVYKRGVYLMSIKGGRGVEIPGTTDACGVSWAR